MVIVMLYYMFGSIIAGIYQSLVDAGLGWVVPVGVVIILAGIAVAGYYLYKNHQRKKAQQQAA
ncbi:hypothetical protein KIPB_005308, partial [Kipferlia bialata]|eukprot:g5308.t1